MKRILIALCLLAVFAAGCTGTTEDKTTTSTTTPTATATTAVWGTGVYQKITAAEAKVLMSDKGVIVLDVRTAEEFEQGHIPGALLLPNTDIATQAAVVLPDKNAKILVYCQGGVRSQSASNELLSMGYTSVIDFGGINDWPYETVTGG
jgi:phage shock protein E